MPRQLAHGLFYSLLLATDIFSNAAPHPFASSPIAESRQLVPRTSQWRGFVAFGDSYAAGIGTGTTSSDGCRRGDHSYPHQLSWQNRGADFQHLACTGSLVGGDDGLLQGTPNSQIDKWQNPQNDDFATVSVGGNDIGFSRILDGCVAEFKGIFAPNCDTVMQEARNKIDDPSFAHDINSALHQILDKANNPDFKIYYTGYITFFNPDTDYCNDVQFNWLEPGHSNPGSHERGFIYLTNDHRRNLNGLVEKLNTKLNEIVTQVNAEEQSDRVFFLDPNDGYKDHRFCEEGVNEPDPNRMDTWMFLNGNAWKDNDLPDVLQTPGSTIGQDGNLEMVNLPDPNSCSGDQDDLVATILCGMSMQITDPNSGVAEYLAPDAGMSADDIKAQAAKDVTAISIPWYVPTRTAKIFHPRSRGLQNTMQMVMNALRDHQDLGGNPNSGSR